ncbi:MAG: precorrin-4 C(11)-methyltransferase [Merismopediaceae bacterium]|nr:precorrin-4 C(11)-methyltransferase [Merismopediaceae bacterium]
MTLPPDPLPHSLKAQVYFIGAGPGDPDLLTLKGYKILCQADVIFYADSLVPKQMLRDIKPSAQVIPTGNQTLETILPRMIEAVRAGQSVVRLQSGDLTLYSAIEEQIQALQEAEIPYECVPGISAFQAAAAQLNAELTIPDLVQTIILTRMSGSASAVPEAEDLASLAAHRASLCLYLAARHVAEAQARLLQHYPPETPVAICFRVGWPDGQIWVVPLDQMAIASQEKALIRTTLYIISPALKTDKKGRSQLYHPQHQHLFRPR